MFLVPTVAIVPLIASCLIISLLSVFIAAPSEDNNKPLTQDKRRELKIKSRTIVIFNIALICLLIVFLSDLQISLSIAPGNLSVALSLIVNHVTKISSGICDRQSTGN